MFMAHTKIVIEEQKPEYELNDDDILDYAKLIGIDVEKEKNLLWIAEEGIAANLPKHWILSSDAKGEVIYSNIQTGEKSWLHPLDNEYAKLVVQERTKCLHPPRFNIRPESRLSSLLDAPPLSSSGKTTPTSLKPMKSSADMSEKKFDFGHFENRRGTKLAPVKLGTLKVPVSSLQNSQKTASGMSFMPKGSSLAKNVRRVNEQEQDLSESRFPMKSQMVGSPDDLNESANSDDGSKYFYEESEDDVEKSYDDMNPSDMGSHFSPTHSTGDSPKARAIDSLVQLSGKSPGKLESVTRKLASMSLNEEQSPLALRNNAQLSALKPLQPSQQKKTPKKYKKTKKTPKLTSNYEQVDTEDDFEYKITKLNEEQRMRFESIQKEWSAMQEELMKEEKAKFDRMVKENTKLFENEESLLRKENASKMSALKNELAQKIVQEENSCKASITNLKKKNEEKYKEEELNFEKKIESLNKSFTIQVEKLEEKHQQAMDEKKKQLEDELRKDIEKIQSAQQENVKSIEEAHAVELTLIKNAHKEEAKNLKDTVSSQKSEGQCEESQKLQSELEEIKVLLENKRKEHQECQDKLSHLVNKVATQQNLLTDLEEKSNKAQHCYEEIQDELDKTEADLDLLRSEKSGLISELNILKESINKEKSNLLKEKKLEVKKLEVTHIGVNTVEFAASVTSQSSQTCIEWKNVSCQVGEMAVFKREAHTQTSVERKIGVLCMDVSCQVDLMKQMDALHFNGERKTSIVGYKNAVVDGNEKDKLTVPVDKMNSDAFLRTTLENALIKMNNKMEERFKLMEEKLGSLDKNLNSHPEESSTNFHNPTNVPSEVSLTFQDNQQDSHHNDTKSHTDLPHKSKPNTKNCSCERGDSGSCEIMQEVKNSVYRLNDILNASYVPSPTNTVIAYPSVGYSSPLESFYSQFRQLQEKYRLKEIKYQLQGESIRKFGTNYSKDFRESGQLSHSLNTYSRNANGDPTSRTRSLVLREQARAWKQQQQYMSSLDMQGFIPLERNYNLSVSDNVSQSPSSLSEQSPVFQYPFLKFEPDPETEYNEWMSRLKVLQDKIRSHQIL